MENSHLKNLTHEELFDILISSPYEDVIKACENNFYYEKICQSDDFWSQKAQIDFGLNANITNEKGFKAYELLDHILDLIDNPQNRNQQPTLENIFIRSVNENNQHLVDLLLSSESLDYSRLMLLSCQRNNFASLSLVIKIILSNEYLRPLILDTFGSSLECSVNSNNLPFVEYIINNTPAGIVSDYNYYNLMLIAASNNYIQIFKYFISIGCDPGGALSLAIKNNNIDAVTFIVENSNVNVERAMIEASNQGLNDIVQYLDSIF